MHPSKTAFESLHLDPSSTVSWIHIGDTHITRAGEQNEIDLGRIVDEINEVYSRGGVDFVFVPGDIADDGSIAAYEVFRSHLDRLRLPWCAIVGDHDVHEKGFENFRKYICPELFGAFSIGSYRFLRLNAFSEPRPDSFIVDSDQLAWLEAELKLCEENGTKAILFLHCYPSDLKQGAEELSRLLRQYPVLLVDMGHTHYNEISNDGTVLYTATRSTGQIEEGPVGYSLTTLDGNNVSWEFIPLGSPSLITVTQPIDDRLRTTRTRSHVDHDALTVRAKVWSPTPISEVSARVGIERVRLTTRDGVLWTGHISPATPSEGVRKLEFAASDEHGTNFGSAISLSHNERLSTRKAVDQENAIGEWKERGLLGTQLGPNKNGRKW